MAGVRSADRCPGVLRPHPAEDGSVVRLRLPGGQTTADTLSALSQLARHYGNPDLQLTSRAGIQLRGLPDPLPDAVAATVLALGLLPSPRHDRVRNIVASPLTGVCGGRADLRGLIHDLDRAIVADPLLAGLPGRFLFVLDDGRGDVSGRTYDLGYRATDGRRGHLLVGGPHLGVPIGAADVVDTLVAVARDFVTAAGAADAWHVGELPGWSTGIEGLGPLPVSLDRPGPVVGELAGSAGVTVPLGLLTPEQVEAVARVAAGPVVVTPWRGLVVPAAAAGLPQLVSAGLVADPASAWAAVSACVGSPGCAKSAGSTRAVARQLIARGAVGGRIHISGCDRRCGAPAEKHEDILLGAAREAVR
jgi:precorrin-3B synthase